MIKIKSRKTFTVKPAEKTPPGRTVPLTLLDTLMFFPHYNSSVHIYRPLTGKVNGESLRGSLSKALVHFYPMAGRYVRPTEEGDVTAIECNDEGVHYVEVETGSVIDDLDLSPSSDFNSLVPSIDDPNFSSHSYPIMLVQVTFFKCGGVSLGVSIEHCAVDGWSAFHLINSWSEICRGGLDISLRPFLDRTSLLRPRDPPRPPRFDHPQYMRHASSGDVTSPESGGDLKVSVFRLGKEKLDEMKAKANQSRQGSVKCSTFEVLAGHVWKCVCDARGVAADRETRLTITVSIRSNDRFVPRLPRGFFGNAVLRAVPVSRAGDLALSEAASKIHDILTAVDDEYSRSVLDLLATHSDPSSAKFGPHIFEPPNFQITSWARLGLNDADFGWGPPVYSGPGWIRSEKAYIFSDDQGCGGLSLAIGLKAQHMEMFEKLFYDLP